jgi:hypothetical protein
MEIAWVDESSPTKDIDEEDWGEGRFLIEDHSLRCITPFNGELYAIAINGFGTLVCTNNVQLEQRASTVNMETLFSFLELGNDSKFYLVKSDGDLLLVLLGGSTDNNRYLEEGQPWCTVWILRAALSMPSVTLAVVPSLSIISGVSPLTPECTRQFDLAASTMWI